MSKTFDDLIITIKTALENGRNDYGIGEDEIYPLAYTIKKKTEGEIFEEANFVFKYSNVHSPELEEKLSFLNNNKNVEVLNKDTHDVDHTDVYYSFDTGDERFNRIVERRKHQIDEGRQDQIEEAIMELEEEPLEFIQDINEEMRKSLKRGE